MVIKRVRFAETNIAYSPPPTPSPTFSENSLPSSDDLLTPSPDFKDGTLPEPLVVTPDSAPQVPGSVRINHMLGYDECPPIEHDLNFHPSFVTKPSTLQVPLTVHELSQAATEPPLPSLFLIADKFPWTISVSAARPSSTVTVCDVLTALHRTLRLPVTSAEFDSLPTFKDMLRVKKAYERRYKAISEPFARIEEEKKGGKRVDFLMGRRFLGLSSTTMGPEFWCINVA
jgi:hypothetical protein